MQMIHLLIQYLFVFFPVTNMRSVIDKAIGGWNDNTCLNLQENPTASPRIQFTESTGCRSWIGRHDPSKTYQEIELGSECGQVSSISLSKYKLFHK
jgi:hypothetical protein